MKIKYVLIASLAIFAISATTLFAEDNTATSSSFFNINEINQMLKNASVSATNKQLELTNIIKRSDAMIAARLISLNNLLSRIQSDNRLTSDEKTSLTNSVQSVITGLNNLKITIDADTDPVKALADSKTIVTNYYVFAQLEPKIRLLVMLNNLQATSTNIQNLIPQIQNIINTLKSQGKDTTLLTNDLSDISTMLTTINTTITSDINTVNAITVATTNNDAVFSQVKSDITTIVKTDFAKIRSDFNDMRSQFKLIILGHSDNATPGATTSGQSK